VPLLVASSESNGQDKLKNDVLTSCTIQTTITFKITYFHVQVEFIDGLGIIRVMIIIMDQYSLIQL